ncbi:hypothetical protein ACS0TY_017205 [Phlomoides rotata]
MAVRLLANVVADLCLGKPPLRSISSSATVADALAALKSSEENFISVWSCDHFQKRNLECLCVGKVCMVDIILYLCREENLSSPASALKSPVSVLLSKSNGCVIHVDPSCSLLDAVDLIVEGAQNLVVPIKSTTTAAISKRKQLQKSSSITTVHKGQEYCWLTQEDVIRFLLCSIGLFSPLPSMSIDTLGIITTEFLAVEYHVPAFAAIEAISRSLADQTSVAVVDCEGTLIGEISPFTLASCDETLAPAIVTLSVLDLMAYIDFGGPPEEIVRVVETRLKEKNLDSMINEFMMVNTYSGHHSSSSEDELSSPTTTLSRQYSRSSSRSARTAEAIVCHPRSSLVAVMIQAISHRVNSVWVVEDDCSVVGIVTFASMLEVFRENLESMI